jgi:hypothetical protein
MLIDSLVEHEEKSGSKGRIFYVLSISIIAGWQLLRKNIISERLKIQHFAKRHS